MQADENADIESTVEDEDESSDDPDLQVSSINYGLCNTLGLCFIKFYFQGATFPCNLFI